MGTIGDFAQLGGAMIVDTDGTIAWSHVSEDASDIAPPAEILAVPLAGWPVVLR